MSMPKRRSYTIKYYTTNNYGLSNRTVISDSQHNALLEFKRLIKAPGMMFQEFHSISKTYPWE